MSTTHEAPVISRVTASQKLTAARLWRLIRKEWAETLRDRRTLITLILMPLLVYPLLSIIFRQFLLSSLERSSPIVVIGVPDAATQQRLVEALKLGERWLNQQDNLPQAESFRVEPPLVAEPVGEQIRFSMPASKQALREGAIDIFVRWSAEPEQRPRWRFIYYENSTLSTTARSFLERRLRAANQFHAWEHQRDLPAPTAIVEYEPLRLEQKPQSMLPTLVPLVLLLMTITGAVYPAIDVTAGERERGTLEALVAAPISRIGLLLAKYVAVVTVALLTAVMNLFAMFFTLYSAGLGEVLFGTAGFSWLLLLQILGLLLLFASFFSALLLAITSFARSFKEAQAYLIPLMLLTLGPGLLSLSPSLELNLWLAATPLINVVLLARDMFLGQTHIVSALVVVISTLLYAALAIRVAATVFGSDAILYGSEVSWSQLWSHAPRTALAPSVGAGIVAFVLALGLQATLGAWLPRTMTWGGVAGQLAGAGIATLLIFLVVPLVLAWWERVPSQLALCWQQTSWPFWFASLLLGVSSGLLVMELTLFGASLGWLKIQETLKTALEQKNAELQQLSLGWVLCWLALVPACAEECCFRGHLFRAWLTPLGPVGTIILTSVLFALFHVISPLGLLWERLLPSLLLGLLLGWLAYRSESVWPGMVLHMLNNVVLLSLARYKSQLILWGWLPEDAEHWPWPWLAASAVGTMVGICIIVCARKPSPHARPSP